VAMETMQALVLHAVGDLRCERVPRPIPANGEALVRVAAVGVCGSDLPRIYEHGTHRFPLIPGHEIAGVVEEVAGAALRSPGERVTVKPLIPCGRCAYCEIGSFAHCTAYDYLGSRTDGGFAEYVLVPQGNLVPLPEGVDLVDAALTEPAAVALHALRQGRVEPGDVVAILGTGPIGMILAQWSHILGAGRVLLTDVDPRKLRLAARLGLGATFNAGEGDPVAWVEQVTNGQGPDLVIEAAGAGATFEQALRMARPLGRVVIMGNPAGEVRLPQGTVSQILRKELTIRGTWNSRFTELPVDEWGVVLDMLASGRLDLASVISHRVPLSRGLEALEMMRSRCESYSRVVLINESAGGGKGR